MSGGAPDTAGMREVARQAGVALSSVSRVLSGHAHVSEEMRARVLTAVEELGYEPNRLAQSLRQGATHTVGFVVGDISNPLFGEIALGAELALSGAGYATVLLNSMNSPGHDAAHIRLLQQRRVDGMLLSVSDETSERTLEALRRTPVPCVLIDRELPGIGEQSAVLSDHAAGMRDAVGHLARLGHRRIALIAGSLQARPTRERVRALEAATADLGLAGLVRVGAFTAEHGAAATAELLSHPRPPTAIVAGGNQILPGVLRALGAAGRRVPADVSVVTCDHVPLVDLLSPPMSVLRRAPVEMGREAATLLLDRLSGGGPQSRLMPVAFEPTESCGPPPGGPV